jgi:putative ABC transport system permease protein
VAFSLFTYIEPDKINFMLINYFKIAWRNIKRNKLFSAINILGLSIGIALCFIIMLYVQDELSYDRFNKNAGQIARIIFNASINGGKISESGIMAPVAETMKKDFPEVKETARLLRIGIVKVNYAEKTFKNDVLAYADPSFFSLFTLPLIEGDAKTALSQPHTLIITNKIAKKYFGNENPIGKTLGFDDNKEMYKVTGVIENIPSNSHFHFDMFASMVGWEPAMSDSWMNGDFHTYLLLKPNADYAAMESRFPAMVEKYMGPQIQRDMGMTISQFRTKGNELGFKLQPLTALHLHADTTTELEPGGSSTYVYIFGAIALFMLLVACINFINLSTAGASRRAKEVGIRKVAGSGKFQLILQFLSESVLIALFALIIGFVLVRLTLPALNNISGKHLLFNTKPVLAFILTGLLVGLMAGIYPAFYLSSFKPIAVLKGKLTADNNSFGLRRSLVVFQFFISVTLIIGTMVVYQQMKYIQNKKLGYDKDQLITIPNSWVLEKNEQAYKQEILRDPRVVNATASWFKPAGPTNSNNAIVYPEGHDNQPMKTVEYHVDEQYIPTLGMAMAAGRNFSKDFALDSLGMIINESAVRAFGWSTMSAMGKKLVRVNSDKGTNVAFHVVGIVKDFNYSSLHNPISPLLMTFQPEGGLIFKVNTTDLSGLLATMKKRWDAFNTGESFTYSFMDDLFNKTYAAEQKTGTILNIFSALTIFVACLGLFGLATYAAEQRRKEIGVRKVLGATVSQLTQLLSTEFLKLVLIASLIAFPVAWWAMNQWLQSFAYRIDISWWIFAIAGFAALMVALLTVSFQAIKAAIANPVKSLRTE